MPEIASNVDAQSLAYQVIVHLLQQNGSTDLAVRMTAAKALANSERWALDPAQLLSQPNELIHPVGQLANGPRSSPPIP